MTNYPIFQNIEPNQLPHLLKCLKATTQHYKKDETILLQGTSTHYIGLITQGSALVISDDYWGNRTIIKELINGEIFGESYACIPNSTLAVSIIAKEDCEVIFLNTRELMNTCDHHCHFHHQIIKNLLTITCQKNYMLTQKITHITQRTLRKKILSYLSDLSTSQNSTIIQVPFNRQQMANYLAVDRSALSNELSQMKKEGLIDFYKNQFKLL